MTKRKLQAILRESAFSPSKPGPLKIISDVGSLNYWITRAIELSTLSLTALTTDQRQHYLKQAISLLALARMTIDEKSK